MKTAPTRRAVAAGTAILALSSLNACGAIGDLVPGNNAFVEQGPRKVAKAGFDEMRDLTSMRVLGSMEDKRFGFTRIDIKLDDTNCTGTLDTAEGSIRVTKTADEAWFSADEDFWQANIGVQSPQADRLIRKYAGNWSSIGKDDKKILGLCDLDNYRGSFTLDKTDTDDTLKMGEVVEVGDADAVPITGRDGKELVTVWIGVDAPHRVLKIAPARDTGREDALYFEEFGLNVVVKTPAKKDIVVLPQGQSPI